MSARLFATLGTASIALIASAPALAQPVMTYEQQQAYEYAQSGMPIPPPPPVVFTQDPVVQPLPAPVAYERYENPGHDGDEYADGYAEGDDYEYEVEERRVRHHPQPHHPQGHHMGHGQMAQPQFDRAAWLEECTGRYNSERRRGGDGDVIGGLMGAAAGGVIGNRVADGDRLAGTLIGAGVGGLAGLAIGSAIDHATREDRRDEALAYCEDWLARYSGGYGHGYPANWHQGAYTYGYAYAQPVMMVQVMVPVEQHAVVREYVTTEAYEEEVVTYERAPAPRQRYIKPEPQKRQRYIKD